MKYCKNWSSNQVRECGFGAERDRELEKWEKKKSYKNNPEYETIFAMNKTRIYKELLKSIRQN